MMTPRKQASSGPLRNVRTPERQKTFTTRYGLGGSEAERGVDHLDVGDCARSLRSRKRSTTDSNATDLPHDASLHVCNPSPSGAGCSLAGAVTGASSISICLMKKRSSAYSAYVDSRNCYILSP